MRRVSYNVENTREGQVLDYDKLTMDIETNGTVTPEDALALSARILQDQLQSFINFEEPEVQVDDTSAIEETGFSAALLKKVDELELSVRSANCLKNDNIVYISGFKSRKAKCCGLRSAIKSLNEIKEVLGEMGLHLGMDVPNWPPENIEELAKKFEENFKAS